MAVSDIDSLKQRAEQVRDETANGANTADRIGGLLLDMVDTIVTRYGITELNGISESALNTQTRVGVYKYSIMKSGASKTDYGLLFVYSSDVPTSGSGDYPLYQTRFQGGKIQTRSRTMPNGLWSDWEEVGIDHNRIAFNSDGTEFAAMDLNKPRTEGRMSLGSNGDVGVSVGNNGELGIGVNRGSKYYPVMEVKKDNKTRFTPVGSPYVMAQMEKGRIIFSSDQVANSEVGVHLDLNGKVATFKAEDKINLSSVNETSIKSSGLYISGIGGYDGTNPGTAKTLQEVVNEGGSPDAVLKNASNQVGDTFSLTSENQKGNITVKAGVQGNATLEGGVVEVKGSASATLSAGGGITVKSNGNTKVEGYTIGILATLSSVNVQASDSVNVSTTDGDINLNPGGQGKAKVNGKEVATTDNMVSTNSKQVITGEKTFTNKVIMGEDDGETYQESVNGIFSIGNKKRGVSNALELNMKTSKASVFGKEIATVDQIGGGSSVEVVQTTGQSTTSVMSQKAVTAQLLQRQAYSMPDGTQGTLVNVDGGTSTNGEPLRYIDYRIEEYAVGADDPSIFTYDGQVHTIKLAQFTVHPQEGDLSFIADNNRGVLLDPTWSYVNFICSNEPRYFSARIGGGKCVLVDTNGDTSGDHYIQLFAEAAYSASSGGIDVTIFAEYKLSGGGEGNNPLYINGNLPGYLRIWIV